MRQFLIPSLTEEDYYLKFLSYERFRYTYVKNFPKYLHSHPFAEIFFVTDGKGYFHIKDKSILIQKGTVVINNANVVHAETPFPDEDLEYAVFSVKSIPFFIHSEPNFENTFILDFAKDFETIFDFIRKLEYEWVVRDEYWQYALQTHLNNLLLYILRNSDLIPKHISGPAKPHSLAEVYLYLTAHYAEDITLEKLCDVFSVNKYTLSHTFKKEYGDSIIHTLNRIRCQTAENILQKTDKSISVICADIGFNSEAYFCKMYKKIMGKTPTETRRSYYVEESVQPIGL